jgi:hypothetical protein
MSNSSFDPARFLDDHERSKANGDMGHLLAYGNFRHGFPSTRAEFTDFYQKVREANRHNGKRLTGTDLVEYVARRGWDDQRLNEDAELHARHAKMLMPIVKEMEARGMDPVPFIEATSRRILAPADIDLSHLDPNLTDAEKAYVRGTVEASRIATEKGLLVSTPADAPPGSSWAEKHAVQTEAGKRQAEQPGIK